MVINMKDYLEKTLRQKLTIKEYVSLYKKLPLIYRGNYMIYEIIMSGVAWIAIKPKKETGLVKLRKSHAMVTKASGLNCALILEKPNYYAKEKLMEEGISFIIPDRQLYLPFLGILLAENENRKLTPVHLISYLTQKLILCAFYEKWKDMTVTKIAGELQVSKMSVSRCIDEIEYLDIPIITKKGKSRAITTQDEGKELWKKIEPLMRNPVIVRYELIEDVNLKIKAGISALCEYTLLSDNEYPTYAITKKDLKDLNLKAYTKAGKGDQIGCVILELGYLIDFCGKGMEDPLSTMLSLTDEEKEDERICISIKEMLEEYVW